MFVFKSTYDKVVQKLDNAEKMNQQLQLEVQRLAEEISAQNTDCRVGAWCKDCRHIRYDRAVVAKSDTPYGYYAKKLINGSVMYCCKHLHDLCPEHSKKRVDTRGVYEYESRNNEGGCEMNFYISDTHFGHFNIIRYDNRPFANTDVMDSVLTENWNKAVTNNDTVYILGDFSWHNEEKTLGILDALNGNKILIKGNHDRISPQIAKRFVKLCDYLEITDKTADNQRVIMSHYPMPFWNGQFRKSIHLYGHVHNSHQWNYCQSIQKELKELQDIPMDMINVGCMMDYMNYTPRTLNEILERSNSDAS